MGAKELISDRIWRNLTTKNMQLFVCCTLLLSFSIRCSYSSKLQMKKFSDNHNRNVLKCLNSLISGTDWVVDNFLLISDDMDTVDDELLQRYSKFGWRLFSTGKNNLTGFYNVILLTNNFQNLNETLSAINIRRMDSRSKFVISLAKNFANLDEIKVASKGIAAAMWTLDKTRVVYLIPCNEDIFAMTYFPFARNCQVGELEVLDVWRGEDFKKGINLFPEKMLDIHGCVQKHSVFLDESIDFQIHKELSETGKIILGGVAGKLITIVAEKMNMALHFWQVQENSRGILIDQVLLGESLFSIAGNIPLASQLEVLDMESAFMEESFAFGYITGGSEVSSKNLLRPLSIETWACVACTSLLFFGFIFFMNQRHCRGITSEKLTIFDSFGIFLGSSRALPRGYFGRYLMGMWIIYSFLINAFYTSSFVSFLTTSNEKRVINTFKDLLAADIDFGGHEFHREFYYDSSDPVMTKIYNNFKIWSEDEGIRMLLNGQGATGVFSSTVYKYNGEHVGDDNHQMRMLKEKAFTFHAPIFMKRGSPFVFGVHRYTLGIIESGLFEYWRMHYTTTSFSGGISTDTASAISMRHLRGILYLYIAGLICSLLVFLLERSFHQHLSRIVCQ